MKCPICGNEDTLSICFLYQYSKIYPITKKGFVSKKYSKEDNGSEEVAVLVCDAGCNVNDLDWDWDWETRKFTIQDRPRWDFKR